MNDVVINKIQGIQRCVRRARKEFGDADSGFATDYTRQDAALLNVLRACETAIDLANYLVRTNRLGVPVSSADSFKLLQAEGVLDGEMVSRLAKMVGFRNMVVHQYADIDLRIVASVITTELDELLEFAENVRSWLASQG